MGANKSHKMDHRARGNNQRGGKPKVGMDVEGNTIEDKNIT